VTATLPTSQHATDATLPVRLHWDVITVRAAEVLRCAPDKITDAMLAELFELTRETIWRFRKGRMAPSLDTALSMSSILGLRVEEIVEQVSA
jgi:DNA-binding XRE family transcriptional regulator